MEIIVKVVFNKGYIWLDSDGVFVKGFLFNSQNQLLKNEELISYFKDVKTKQDFKRKVTEANGQFSVIIKKEDEVFLAVDRTRTFPLFYSFENQRLIISDSAKAAAESELRLSQEKINEFIHIGYVLGQNTLLEKVHQLVSGQLAYAKKISIDLESYFDYKMDKEISNSSLFLEKKLARIIDDVGKRVIELLKNRTAVIPLSGGYDSRLIASLLKRANYNNVICFTYGTLSSNEIKTSKKVAQQLGFPWHFIQYDKELIKGFLQTEDFNQYYPFASNYTSSFFTQDYFAVQYLKKHHLIPKDSVFVPGHSGDLLAGGHIPHNLTKDNLISAILKKHFKLRGRLDSNFGEKIEKSFINGRPFEEFDNWNFKERQGKFIVNSNRIYEYFGYEHLIPLWDKELILFFQNIDLKFKINKILYDQVIFKYYFDPLFIAFKKPKNSFLKQKTIGILHRLYRKLFYDPTNFKYIAYLFSKDEKLDVKWNNTLININAIQSSWYIKKLKKQS